MWGKNASDIDERVESDMKAYWKDVMDMVGQNIKIKKQQQKKPNMK